MATDCAAVFLSSWQRRKEQDLNTKYVTEGKEPVGWNAPIHNPGRQATAFLAKTKGRLKERRPEKPNQSEQKGN